MQVFDDILVHDEFEVCPYLPDQIARMPLHVPSNALSPGEVDRRLAHGQRRTGDFVYQTQCPQCRACESIRVLVREFNLNRTMRRTLARNDKLLQIRFGPVQHDAIRADMFNRHRFIRGLDRGDVAITPEDYAWAFAKSCFSTFEIGYYLNDQLICVAITDVGERAVSAVYTYYDPEFQHLSLGTYSILKQIEYCQENAKEFLYLGFYIERSPSMVYKARFYPHERLLRDRWVRFDKPKS
ncbi:MAG TPA: arginyltransferase [Pirellulaceae bacterium]|nr:arginyltransferase [Pirellulaceae bacterium]HMO93176.1 arginyltransferase [Pirellulaceae bacterium]HMP69995.1 arginyltransferase [Pirellulaceae bacterium]